MTQQDKFELAKRLVLSFEEYVKWIHQLAQGTEYDMTPAHSRLCAKLQEYAEGRNTKRNLLVNVCPGFGKSLLLQYFITWCFARNKNNMFCYVAYGERLIKKLSRDSRNLMMMPEWEELFGREMDPNDKSVLNYHLISGGVRSGLTAGTVSSALLGLDAGVPGVEGFSGALLCFPYNVKVLTPEGEKKIGFLAENKVRTKVLSTGGWADIIGWQVNPGSALVEVKYRGGTLKCTPDHKINTKRGWVRADALKPGDIIVGAQSGAFASPNSLNLVKAEAILGASNLSWQRFNVGNNAFRDWHKVLSFCASNGREFSACNDIIKQNARNSIKLASSRVYFNNLFGGQGCVCEAKVADRIGHIFFSGAIFKVFNSIVHRVVVDMANIITLRAFAKEGGSNGHMNRQTFINTIDTRGTKKVANSTAVWSGNRFYKVLCHNLFRHNVTAEAITNGILLGVRIRPALNSSKIGSEVVGIIGDWFPNLTVKGKAGVLFNACCNFSHTEVLSVKRCNSADKTYCLTVKKYHNFFAKSSGVFMLSCSNCDDINSPEVRTSVHEQIETPETYQRKLATRRRTPTVPTICIQQRLDSNDFSGWVLKNEPDEWEVFIVPALDEATGESFYPKRFPAEELRRIQKQNPYMFAAMYQQAPLENYGAYFHEEWIRTYRVTPEEFQKVFITTDFGMSANKGDKTLFCCWGLGKDNNLYLLRTRMGKWEVPDGKKFCIEFFQRCRAAFRQCRRVYIENTLSGIGFIQEMRRECPEMAIVPLRRGAKKNKMNRVDSAMTWLEAGRVYFREADPNFVPLRAELLAWSPSDKNPTDEICDNVGDACEIAFNQKTSSIFI